VGSHRITGLRQLDGADLIEALRAMCASRLDGASARLRHAEPVHRPIVRVPAGVGQQAVRDARAAGQAVVGRKLRRRLLACGIAASLLAVGTDIVAGKLWVGYDFMAESVSELAAVGAPTRPLVVPLNLTYDALMIAFGMGVWASAGEIRGRRMTGSIVIASAVVSVAWAFFPMHVGEPASPANVALGAVSVVLSVIAICCGAVAYRGFVRFYSIATLLAYLGLTIWGILLGRAAPAESSPLTGAQERTMALGYLLWVVALAVILLGGGNRQNLESGERPGGRVMSP
jgi:hypothetical protein